MCRGASANKRLDSKWPNTKTIQKFASVTDGDSTIFPTTERIVSITQKSAESMAAIANAMRWTPSSLGIAIQSLRLFDERKG